MSRLWLVRLFLLLVFGSLSCTMRVDDEPDGGPDGGVQLGYEVQALAADVCGSSSGTQADAPWPMRGGCSTRAKSSWLTGPESPDPANRTPPVRNWTSASLGGDVRSGVVVDKNGWIYVGSSNSRVYQLSPLNGSTARSATVGGAVSATPAIATDGTVVVGSQDKKVYALNPSTLAVKWSHTTGGAISSSAAIGADGTVYVGSDDGTLRAIHGSTGTAKWTFTTGARVASSPAISRDGTLVYFGSADKSFYAVQTTNGALKWKVTFASAILGSPVVGRLDNVYVPVAKSVVALNWSTGSQVWSTSVGNSCSVTALASNTNGILYAAKQCTTASENGLSALTPAGANLWNYRTTGAVLTTPIVDAVGTIFFADDQGFIIALSSSGALVWRHQPQVAVIQSGPALGRDGELLIGSNADVVYSFGKAPVRKGQGAACSRDRECAAGLLCGANNGSRFGLSAPRACVAPSCENGIKDNGEAEPDCGGPCGACTGVCTTSCVVGEQVLPHPGAVLSFDSGVFLRASDATYQTSQNTLEHAGWHRLRYENRGDGHGRVPLFEGARKNLLASSESLDTTQQWYCGTVGSPCASVTPNVAAAPDGATTADRITFATATTEAPTQNIDNEERMFPGVLSTWIKNAQSGAASTRPVFWTESGQWSSTTWPLAQVWERRELHAQAFQAPTVRIKLSHRSAWPGSASEFPALGAAQVLSWGWQLEKAPFASSYIRGGSERAADRLVFEPSLVPQWMRDGVWQFDVYPAFDHEAPTEGDFVLVAWEDGALSLRVTPSEDSYLRIRVGQQVQDSSSIAWSSNDKLTITVDVPQRVVSLLGVLDGQESITMTIPPGSIAGGRLAIGASMDGSNSAFSRLSEPRQVPSELVNCAPDPDCNRCGDGFINGDEGCDTALNPLCAADCSETVGSNLGPNCGPGQVLGTDNGGHFNLPSSWDVCWPAIPCEIDPNLACGSMQDKCGQCECTPNCADSACGNDDDGCGAMCNVECAHPG